MATTLLIPDSTGAIALGAMDQHTLELLEFDRVRQLVARYASSPMGKKGCGALAPLVDVAIIRLAIEQTSEMVEALELRLVPPLAGLRDVEWSLRRAALGVMLDTDALVDLRLVLDVTARVNEFALRLGANFPRLTTLLGGLPDFRHLARALDVALDFKGHVLDTASPELRDIRRQMMVFDDKIQVELRRLLRNPEIRKALRYPSATLSGSHHVLPVAVNFRHKVVGIVHRTSSTGETIYIEPAKVAELSAEISVLRSAEQREIRKVLRRLSDLVQADSKSLLTSLEVLTELDVIHAKACYSREYAMAAPEIVERGPIRLNQAHHPLLDEVFRRQNPPGPTAKFALKNDSTPASHSSQVGDAEVSADLAEGPVSRRVVPISLELGASFDLLVITGPNTGGKTVAIKSLGLLAAMALSGLHIPASPSSQIPLLTDILADIGDEQSLEQSLSTFSGHIARIGEILGKAGPTTLVLLDELGAGTEPSEGAALGRAILDELIERGCPAVVTTHLNDLKSYALEVARAENAAFEFDAVTLKPTYRLVLGRVGESCALKIAQRLNLPRPLLARAYHHLRRARGSSGVTLGPLEKARQAAAEALRQAQDAQQAAHEAAEDFRKRSEQLSQEQDVRTELARARSLLGPGDSVRIAKIGKTGTVVRVDTRKQLAIVRVGAVEWQLPLEDLIPQFGGQAR